MGRWVRSEPRELKECSVPRTYIAVSMPAVELSVCPRLRVERELEEAMVPGLWGLEDSMMFPVVDGC